MLLLVEPLEFLRLLRVNLKAFSPLLQDTLQQLIVMPLPDILCVARDPISGKGSTPHLILMVPGQWFPDFRLQTPSQLIYVY